LDLLDPSNDPEFFWQVISGPPCIISDIVKPNIPDTIANIKQKSLHGRYFKELEQPEVNVQASHAWLKKSNINIKYQISEKYACLKITQKMYGCYLKKPKLVALNT
jgi:hypothetical protein